MAKEIYASLEIAEREVRVLVSECYNTRFNIIQVARAKCDGIKSFNISDEELVKKAIKDCMSQVYKKVGATLRKVILLIPPVNYQRIPLKSKIVPGEQGLKIEDVSRALNKTLDIEIEDDYLVINRIPVSYMVNGISSKRIPLNEKADEVAIDVDLLCADRQLAYQYVNIVEECGLNVIDICLSNYAAIKEANLLEQSVNSNVVLLDVNNTYTNMSLITKGKVVSCVQLDEGLEKFVSCLYEKYGLPYDKLMRLLKYNGSMNTENKDVILAYTKNGKSCSIGLSEFNEEILPSVEEYVDHIKEMCSPILESGKTCFDIVSEGADMILIADMISTKIESEVKIIHTDVIGARDSELIALYGSLFACKELYDISGKSVNCVDEYEFESVVDHKKFEEEGETFTTKIRAFFKQYNDKEKNNG